MRKPLVHQGMKMQHAHRSVDELIEVLVVAEDDVAAHVEEEALRRNIGARQAASLVRLRACGIALVEREGE